MQPFPSIGYVKETGTSMGRGMFASRAIAAGEVIEVCPVMKFETPFQYLPIEVRNVVFAWSTLVPGLKTKANEKMQAIALGYGSLYNHANPANARYKADSSGEFLVISAARDIDRDEQITINYNASAGEPTLAEDNWFDFRDIALYSPPGQEA